MQKKVNFTSLKSGEFKRLVGVMLCLKVAGRLNVHSDAGLEAVCLIEYRKRRKLRGVRQDSKRNF